MKAAMRWLALGATMTMRTPIIMRMAVGMDILWPVPNTSTTIMDLDTNNTPNDTLNGIPNGTTNGTPNGNPNGTHTDLPDQSHNQL